jgi:hypothetical protein
MDKSSISPQTQIPKTPKWKYECLKILNLGIYLMQGLFDLMEIYLNLLFVFQH